MPLLMDRNYEKHQYDGICYFGNLCKEGACRGELEHKTEFAMLSSDINDICKMHWRRKHDRNGYNRHEAKLKEFFNQACHQHVMKRTNSRDHCAVETEITIK